MSKAYQLTQIFLIISIVFQTLEYFSLRKKLNVWKWNEVREEYSFLKNPFFEYTLNEKGFVFLLSVRLICAFILFFSFSFFPLMILLFSTLLIALRFRGSFNGGSDYMTSIVLSALCIGSLFPGDRILSGVLFYIALQSVTSYFLAGLVKIKQPGWRNGEALKHFIHSPNYNPPFFIKRILAKNSLAMASAWTVMLAELLFPLVLLCGSKTAVLTVLCGAFLFHLNNVLLFGLNRFLLAWLTTYPSIYFTALYFATNKFSNSP
jgi:uncharacterized membrane protein YphA (DoxX/SURF4 family)